MLGRDKQTGRDRLRRKRQTDWKLAKTDRDRWQRHRLAATHRLAGKRDGATADRDRQTADRDRQ